MSEKGMPASLVKHLQQTRQLRDSLRNELASGATAPALMRGHCYGDPGLCLCLGRSVPGCQKVVQQLGATASPNVPQPIPVPQLLDLLSAEVLSAASKPAIRQALGLLLHELGRRGAPLLDSIYTESSALLAELPNSAPSAHFTSAEAAIAHGIDPTEVAGKGGRGDLGATDSTSSNSPPEVTILTPGELLSTTFPPSEAASLCANSAGILQLKKEAGQ